VAGGLCTISVVGPQDLNNATSTGSIDEALDTLTVNVDVAATNDGSAWCGPPSGTANLAATYATSPANLVVDP